MIKFFKTKKHPKKSFSYAVTTGTYVGEILVYIGETETDYRFISIPKNVNRNVPKEKFEYGLDSKIVEFVEKIPNKVFKILEKQFEFNDKNSK
jgi:hypothetical protein